MSFKNMQWLNEPLSWSSSFDDDLLEVLTDQNTDFWNKTYYGFSHDNGHFMYKKVTGDFSAKVTFSAEYSSQYDQAGIMLWGDASCWMKAGIEYSHGQIHISTVVTNDFSDWSVMALPNPIDKLTMRVSKAGMAVCVQYLEQGEKWKLLRLGYMKLPIVTKAGIMCCSPVRSGLKVRFYDFSINKALTEEEMNV